MIILICIVLIMLYLLVNAPALLMRPTIQRSVVDVEDVRASVIVAVRNEERYVNRLIQNLLQQSYHNKEIIIVNDHSTDGTARELVKYHGTDGITVLHLQDGVTGKKAAIRYGEQTAAGNLL